MSSPSGVKTLYDGQHLVLRLRDGWEYAERPGITGIIAVAPVTDDGKLVLVEQYRIPVQCAVMELPAGLVGDDGPPDETLESAARRELLEETGYEAHTWRRIASGPPSPGLSTEVVTFFLATGLRKTGAGGGVDDESIIVHEVPIGGVGDWIAEKERAGFLVDPKVYIGLRFAEKHIRGGLS
ncbi:MAG: ADP-ribose pyrophosphatase [Candidatus Sumerlaeota bacterium]|nr:ADP-ribose pyrophosphatase [Candidatus Sumerlaeota bacterium]